MIKNETIVTNCIVDMILKEMKFSFLVNFRHKFKLTELNLNRQTGNEIVDVNIEKKKKACTLRLL